MTAVVVALLCIWARHAFTGEWPGPRYPEWVYPMRARRAGVPRARFGGANPYCIHRGGHWMLRRWYRPLVTWFVWEAWDPPLADVVLIGRPPVRTLARAA